VALVASYWIPGWTCGTSRPKWNPGWALVDSDYYSQTHAVLHGWTCNSWLDYLTIQWDSGLDLVVVVVFVKL
jgi:hypothetical protein